MKKLLLTIVGLLLCSQSYAATYHISQSSGNDSTGDGSISTPYKTADAIDGANFLSCGDKVLLKAGDTWTGTEAIKFGEVNSTCATASNPIIFDRYGNGADPIIAGNSAYGGSWTLDSGSIYYASSITWTPVNTVAVDGSSALWRTDAKADMEAGTWFFDDAADRVYVWLADSSNPSGHAVVIGRYPTTENGLLNPYPDTNGGGWTRNNANFLYRNIDVRYSNWYGAMVTGNGITYDNVKFRYGGLDGFIASTYGNWDASYATIRRSHIAYNNSSGGGYGQGVTFNSPYGRAERNLIEYNGMAGIDVLDYHATNSDARYVVIKNNTIRYNAAWKGRTGVGNYDPGLYVDGANNVLLYGNEVYDNGDSNGTNSSVGIYVFSENPSAKYAYNIYVLNNYSHSPSYEAFEVSEPNSTQLITGSWVMGNTFVRGDSFLVGSFNASSAGGLKMYYNIFDNNGSAYPLQTISVASMTAYTGDYNVFTDSWYVGSGVNARTQAQICSTYGEECNSRQGTSGITSATNVRLAGGSASLDFSDGSQWANLPDWVKAEIGPNQPRGTTVAADTDDTGNADNGFHFNSGGTASTGVVLQGVTVT